MAVNISSTHYLAPSMVQTRVDSTHKLDSAKLSRPAAEHEHVQTPIQKSLNEKQSAELFAQANSYALSVNQASEKIINHGSHQNTTGNNDSLREYNSLQLMHEKEMLSSVLGVDTFA